MTARVLVLGGTAWLGGHIARAHRDLGAAVTALARGSRAGGDAGDAPEGVDFVSADRELAGAYDALTGEWDEVIDLTRVPAHARGALDALAGRTAHWTFVSSVSAQRLDAPLGADEDDALVAPDATGADYGGAKVWIEQAVQTAVGDRARIVRPGLIGGPGDPSDRFGYWVARAALAGDEPMIAPSRDQSAQVIDVRDLAAFIAAGSDRTGVVNAVGAPTRLHDLIAIARSVARHSGELVQLDDAQLDAHDIGYWAGPRALPLRLPADLDAHAARSHARYTAEGGAHRDAALTTADVLADEFARKIGRDRATGLTRLDELLLIDAVQRR